MLSCLREGTLLFRLFTKEKVVYIGLLSYSLYLWHWGVLSISRWTIGIHWWTVPFQVGLIFLLAITSYNLVETPLRRNDWSLRRYISIGIGIIALVISSLIIFILGKPLRPLLFLGEKNRIDNYSDNRFWNREFCNNASYLVKR